MIKYNLVNGGIEMEDKKNILIGGAWPYANSSLHLGHLAGLISGDILARYFRLKGNNVLYVSGSDCHGTPITERAKKEGKNPREISDYYDKEFREVFKRFNYYYFFCVCWYYNCNEGCYF